MHDDDTETSIDLRLSGNPRSLENVLLFLKFLQSCSTLGTTQWVRLMVDGDGDFRFAVEHDGRASTLTDEEQAFLFADPEDALAPPGHLAHLYFRRLRAEGEVTLDVEFV